MSQEREEKREDKEGPEDLSLCSRLYRLQVSSAD